jgi:hypothetical protein
LDNIFKGTGPEEAEWGKTFDFDTKKPFQNIWNAVAKIWNDGVEALKSLATFTIGGHEFKPFDGLIDFLMVKPGTWGTTESGDASFTPKSPQSYNESDVNEFSEGGFNAFPAGMDPQRDQQQAAALGLSLTSSGILGRYDGGDSGGFPIVNVAKNVIKTLFPPLNQLTNKISGGGAGDGKDKALAEELARQVEAATTVYTEDEANEAKYQKLLQDNPGSFIWNKNLQTLIYGYHPDMQAISPAVWDYYDKPQVLNKFVDFQAPSAPVPTYSELIMQGISVGEIDRMMAMGEATYGQTGGIVPGPRGAPRAMVLHGGEMVLPTHLGRGWRDATRGGMSLKRFHGSVAGGNFGDDNFGGGNFGGGGRINMMNKPTTINIMTTESAVATIESIERMQMMDEASFYSTM